MPAHYHVKSSKQLAPRRAFKTSQTPHRPSQRSSAALHRQSTCCAVADGSVSVVLLAGGVGKRMGADIPKQYIEVHGMPIACYSLSTFARMPEIREIVIVCEPDWRHVFEAQVDKLQSEAQIKWALPGKERQDSVYNGFSETDQQLELVAIHDSARPLVEAEHVRQCMEDALQHGAAVLGVPVKPTIKEVGQDMLVERTLIRSKLWDVQTPQIIKPALLQQGFEVVKRDNLEVTDDVSIVEAIGKPVKMTQGSYNNIKVTTPDDMSLVDRVLQSSTA